MRKEDLPRVEGARVVGLLVRAGAEEGHLKTHRVVEPTGDVPPLGAELRMRAVVAREGESPPRSHLRINDVCRPCAPNERKYRQKQEIPAPHQSSRTARTGPMPIASRPESTAVITARTMRTVTRESKSTNGGCRSMLQLNDCRFTT